MPNPASVVSSGSRVERPPAIKARPEKAGHKLPSDVNEGGASFNEMTCSITRQRGGSWFSAGNDAEGQPLDRELCLRHGSRTEDMPEVVRSGLRSRHGPFVCEERHILRVHRNGQAIRDRASTIFFTESGCATPPRSSFIKVAAPIPPRSFPSGCAPIEARSRAYFACSSFGMQT